MNKRVHGRSGGFTLIELLVVLVILGLIAGLVVPNIVGQTEKARARAAKASIQQLSNAIDTYYLDTGQLPDRLEDLVREPASAENWNGPYAKQSTLTDPWDQQWEYRVPGDHGAYDLISLGADGAPGGEGNNADIKSWE